MKNASLLGLAAAASTLFTACLFSGESNSPGRASVQMQFGVSASTAAGTAASAAALAKSAGLILGDTAGVHVDLSDAKIVVSRIKLESESGEDECGSDGALKKDGVGEDSSHETDNETEKEKECEDAHELALKGPFVIDLLTGASTPDLGTLSVPAGVYDRVKIEMHHGQNDSTLGGRTLVAHGTLTLADGSTKPFSLSLTLDENLKIKSDSGMTLDAGTLNTVAVKLMAGDWLKGIDIASCMGSIDPAAASVDITEESPLGKCLDAEHILKGNFRDSFRAEDRDHDEDGKDGSDDNDSTSHSGKGK
jgi:hypothetical protein